MTLVFQIRVSERSSSRVASAVDGASIHKSYCFSCPFHITMSSIVNTSAVPTWRLICALQSKVRYHWLSVIVSQHHWVLICFSNSHSLSNIVAQFLFAHRDCDI